MVSCSRQRVQLTDMWSATLVIGTNQEACGSVWTRGEQRAFRSGDILLANGGEVQRTLPSKQPSSYFTIFWERSTFERLASAAGTNPHWSLALLANGPVSLEFARLRDLLECGADAEAVESAYHSTTAALLRAVGHGPEAPRAPSHPTVRRAALYASTNLGEALSLEQIAREVHLSKCHLVRCFQNAIGVPPHRYRTLLRLQQARRLLEAGHAVADVADQTGFADAPHLTRSFREWLGVSPAAWGSAWRASDPWSQRRPKTLPPPMLR
ncbi:MAG: AraC family transcriptional regulator [Polyangiaceae bacterium]